MKLAEVIETFVAENEWKDEIKKNDDTGECQLATGMNICNQPFDLYVEGDEETELLSLFLYPPFKVMEGKFVDACMLFNYLNDGYMFRGRITVSDKGRIRYREVIDTENLETSASMVHNMLFSGVKMFEMHMEAIAAVALTRKTYEAVREEYDKKEALRESQADTGGGRDEAKHEDPEQNRPD